MNPYTRTQPNFLLNYCCLITIGINTVAVINPISVSKTKNANELAECREMRLYNQHQYDYQTEKIICELADHILHKRLANEHQHQNEKNAYSSTITGESRKFKFNQMLITKIIISLKIN